MRGHRGVVLIPLVAALGACYEYVPMHDGRVEAGQRYAFEITDQGRVGLAGRLGPGVVRVEGTLTAVADDSYVMSVAGIETIDGGSSHWTGERVTVPESYVGRLQARVFSRGRTVVALGAAAAALGAFIVTRSLQGGGTPPVTTNPGPGSGS